MTPRKTPEIAIEDYLVKSVQARGGMALKGNVQGRRFVDRIVILPRGVTAYIECKRPVGGRFTAHQIETMTRLRELGQLVASVSTRAEVDALLSVLDARGAA